MIMTTMESCAMWIKEVPSQSHSLL